MSPTRGTPPVTFRLDPELKARAMAKAAERGETLTDVLVRAVREYVREEDGRVFVIRGEACVCHEGGSCPVHVEEES